MPQQEAKYKQIIDWVQEGIANGTYRSGDRLLSENELSERFSLSRETVRRALGLLEHQQLIHRVRGSGTYIGPAPSGEGAAAPMLRRRERYGNIAVVSTFYESYIFPPTLKGIEHVLTRHGYAMQVAFTDNRIQREETILHSILEKNHVDGLIVEPVKSALPNPNLKLYEQLRREGVPIIYFNTFYPEFPAPCVRLDDTTVARKATDLLIEAGHQKIAGIFKSDDGQGPLRYQGYIQALSGAALPIDQRRILWIDTTAGNALEEMADYLFLRMEGSSAVVCYNDLIAYQVMDLAAERGITVPDQLSVVGIDDAQPYGTGQIALTTFPHPKELLGEKVAENMIGMIEQPGFAGDYLFDVEAQIRSSVKRI